MDKAEYKIKLDQINSLAESGDFPGAAAITDTVDWRHVKNVRTLCMVGEIYEATRRYDDSLRVLKYAYKRSGGGKTILYRLTELSVKLGDIDGAKQYEKEFETISPTDSSKYILQYKIMRREGAPISDQIDALKEYKEHEYTERWAYELAKLYKKNGQNDKCITECDDMILWFSEGKYVTKAMELKMGMTPLTANQQKQYNSRYVRPAAAVASSLPTKAPAKSGLDEIEKVISRTDEDEDAVPVLGSTEAISKMSAAASVKVPEVAASAANKINTPNVTVDARRTFSENNRENVQNQLADSIRAVFAGIQKPGSEEVPAAEAPEMPVEDFSDVDVRNYRPEHTEDLSQYTVKKLEPESIHTGAVKAPKNAVEDQSEQITLDEYLKPKKEKEADLDALFAETKNQLASAVASGNFVKTDSLMEEKTAEEAAQNETAESTEAAGTFAAEKNNVSAGAALSAAIAAAAAGTAADTAAAESAVKTAAEPAAKQAASAEPAAKQAASAEPAMKQAASAETAVKPSADELLARETDESLGLTREFNFHEELQKAMVSGDSISEAAKKVSARAEQEAAGAVEGVQPTPFASGDTQEFPQELLRDAGEQADQKEEKGGFSADVDETQDFEQNKSIIEDIMEKPETIRTIPVEPRKLDDDEKKLLSYFASIPGVSEQVTKTIADVHNNAGDKTSRSGNILMVGRQGSGKTTLADSVVLAICRNLNIKAAKVAHIVSTDFNQKDPASVVAKMSGGFLVIEGAGALSDESIDKLSRAMEFRTDDLVVILEDEKADLQGMLTTHPSLEEKFTSSIIIPVFTNDELVTFAKTYTKERGYKMDEMGVLALYTMIGDNQKDKEPVTVGKVKGMVDTAISRADKGTRKLGRKFSKKAVDGEGRILLHEKDFDF